MAITAFPIQTLAATASNVVNVPSGQITATNVQAALGQLDSLVASNTSDIALNNVVFNVKNYGATGADTGDDTAAIQAAINAADAANGGVVYFPPGTYRIYSTLNINNSNIALIGAGGDGLHDGGTGSAPASILAAFFVGIMVHFATTFSAGASIIYACQMRGIALHGRNTATIGLKITSIRGSIFDNVFIKDVEQAGMYTTCGVTGTNTAEPADVTNCYFRNIQYRMLESTSATVGGIVLNGSTNANTSYCRFEMCSGQTRNGHGFELIHCDNNIFTLCRPSTTGTGKNFLIHGFLTAASSFADSNTFINCQWAAGGCVLQGTDSGFNSGTTRNAFYSIDDGNGIDFPVFGVGSRALAIKCNGEMICLSNAPVLYANLPATPTNGMRAYITDGLITTFAAIAAGGGTNKIPVYYDSPNWRYG